MSRFPPIPLLETVSRHLAAPKPLQGFAVVCVQHLLETTGSLIEHLIELGVCPSDIFIVGKPYSTCADVAVGLTGLGVHVWPGECPVIWGGGVDQIRIEVNAMWHQVADLRPRRRWRGIIVLDDGGHCAAAVPDAIIRELPVIGVEQTMAGVREPYPVIPVVEVASSAAKTLLEPAMIRDAVLARLHEVEHFSNANRVYGVVGVGNIGRAVASALAAYGHEVHICDRDRDLQKYEDIPRTIVCKRLHDIFEQSTCIFGCTGTDVLYEQTWWRELQGRKTLVSCSSYDVEFRTILATLNDLPAAPGNKLADVHVPTERGRLRIVRGGCPVNFDGSRESVPLIDIQLTRALLLAGALQAACARRFSRCENARLMLSPGAQQVVVGNWLKARGSLHRYTFQTLAIFESVETVAAHSGGTPMQSAKYEFDLAARRSALCT